MTPLDKPPYPWAEHMDHDSFGELDLSGSGGKSGAIGCMVDWMVRLDQEERRLARQLASNREAHAIAMQALDRFVEEDTRQRRSSSDD